MQFSAFVQTPFLTHRPYMRPSVCMRLPEHPSNTPKPLTPPSSLPTPLPNTNGAPSNGTALSNGTSPSLASGSPPPPEAPLLDPRPERPDDQSEELSSPVHQRRHAWAALHNRLQANPRLPLQLVVELTVGGVSKTLAELQDRGERFVKEFDHYLLNLSLELFGDAMLVWLLSPVAGAALRPKHIFQVGSFTRVQRGMAFLMKGAQFGLVGVASSAVGQGVTRALVKARGGDVEKLPPVAENCLAWGGFLWLSSNTRYQLVNGFEQRVLERFLPGGALSAATTFALRFGNCYLGGLQWLPWVRFLGVQ